MKILLASMSIEDVSRFDPHYNFAYPIGLSYIYSVLERDGYEVDLKFLNNYSYEDSEKIFFDIQNPGCFKSGVLFFFFSSFEWGKDGTFEMNNRYLNVCSCKITIIYLINKSFGDVPTPVKTGSAWVLVKNTPV